MLDRFEENQENDEYIQKAMTCGVRIRNHGDDARFKAQVDGFKEILEGYNQNEAEVDLGPTQPLLNIKTQTETAKKSKESLDKDMLPRMTKLAAQSSEQSTKLNFMKELSSPGRRSTAKIGLQKMTTKDKDDKIVRDQTEKQPFVFTMNQKKRHKPRIGHRFNQEGRVTKVRINGEDVEEFNEAEVQLGNLTAYERGLYFRFGIEALLKEKIIQ